MSYPIQSNLAIGGVATISINGVAFLLGDDYSWAPSTPERSVVKGRSGIYGHDEKPSEGFMKGKAYDYNGNSVTDIGNMTNAAVIANLRNGKTITATVGFNTEKPEVAADGSFNFNFASADVRETST